MAGKSKSKKKGGGQKAAKTAVKVTGYVPPDGDNRRAKDLDKGLDDWCKLQGQEDALIELHVAPIREKKNRIKSDLKSRYGIPTKAFNARASLRQVELGTDDETTAAVNELFAATPIGKGVDMLDLLDRIKEKRADEAKAAKEKETKGTSKEVEV